MTNNEGDNMNYIIPFGIIKFLFSVKAIESKP